MAGLGTCARRLSAGSAAPRSALPREPAAQPVERGPGPAATGWTRTDDCMIVVILGGLHDAVDAPVVPRRAATLLADASASRCWRRRALACMPLVLLALSNIYWKITLSGVAIQ